MNITHKGTYLLCRDNAIKMLRRRIVQLKLYDNRVYIICVHQFNIGESSLLSKRSSDCALFILVLTFQTGHATTAKMEMFHVQRSPTAMPICMGIGVALHLWCEYGLHFATS